MYEILPDVGGNITSEKGSHEPYFPNNRHHFSSLYTFFGSGQARIVETSTEGGVQIHGHVIRNLSSSDGDDDDDDLLEDFAFYGDVPIPQSMWTTKNNNNFY